MSGALPARRASAAAAPRAAAATALPRLRAAALLALLASCAGGVTTTPATGPGLAFRPEPAASDEPALPPGASSAVPAPPPPGGGPPDPQPLRSAEQVEYRLRWQAGRVTVLGVRRLRAATPVVTPRRMGRFAVELWIGPELIERLRFDFPLLAADDPERPGPRRIDAPPSLGAAAVVDQVVSVPASSRARRVELVDRGTGRRWPLPWPLDLPAASSAAPAPAASSAAPAASSAAPAPAASSAAPAASAPPAPASSAPR